MLSIYNSKPNFQTLLNPCINSINSINNLYDVSLTIKRVHLSPKSTFSEFSKLYKELSDNQLLPHSLPNISYVNQKDG